MKFDYNGPAGLRDIYVWKCGRTDAQINGKTDGRWLESYTNSSPGAFGPGELKTGGEEGVQARPWILFGSATWVFLVVDIDILGHKML